MFSAVRSAVKRLTDNGGWFVVPLSCETHVASKNERQRWVVCCRTGARKIRTPPGDLVARCTGQRDFRLDVPSRLRRLAQVTDSHLAKILHPSCVFTASFMQTTLQEQCKDNAILVHFARAEPIFLDGRIGCHAENIRETRQMEAK